MVGIVLCIAFLVVPRRAEALSLPERISYVTDHDGVLSKYRVKKLNKLLEKHEGRSQQQFVVVAIGSLDGASPDEYLEALMTDWHVGGGDALGLVLLLVTENQKAYVHVSERLKSAIPPEAIETTTDQLTETAFETKLLGRVLTRVIKRLANNRGPDSSSGESQPENNEVDVELEAKNGSTGLTVEDAVEPDEIEVVEEVQIEAEDSLAEDDESGEEPASSFEVFQRRHRDEHIKVWLGVFIVAGGGVLFFNFLFATAILFRVVFRVRKEHWIYKVLGTLSALIVVLYLYYTQFYFDEETLEFLDFLSLLFEE